MFEARPIMIMVVGALSKPSFTFPSSLFTMAVCLSEHNRMFHSKSRGGQEGLEVLSNWLPQKSSFSPRVPVPHHFRYSVFLPPPLTNSNGGFDNQLFYTLE